MENLKPTRIPADIPWDLCEDVHRFQKKSEFLKDQITAESQDMLSHIGKLRR
jgi:hypothetical protein